MNMLKKINEIFDKRQKRNFIILFIVIFIGGFVELLGVSVILPLIEVILDPNAIQANQYYLFVYELFNMTSAREFVFMISMVLIFVYIVKNIYILEMNNLQFMFTYNNQRRIAYRLMSCYLYQDYLGHISKNTAELQRNITQDVNDFFATILYILQLATEIIVCLMLLIYLLIVDFQTTLGVTVIIGIFTGGFYWIYKKRLVKSGERYRFLNGLVFKWIQQSLGGMKEIKILNREQYFLNIFDTNYEKSMRTMRKQKMINLLPKPIMETICICGLLAVIAFRIYIGEDMTQFVATLSVFALAAFRILPSFNRITMHLSNIMFSKASVNSIYDELKRTEKELPNVKQQKEEQKTTITFEKEIKINHLCFAYPKAEKNVIDDLNLVIPKNKSIAFIGSSGSGKTTLVDLILGVLTPKSGEIQSDDTNIAENMEEWHKRIGYIPQTIYLLDDSIRNNIAFGIPEKEIKDEMIWYALEEAKLDEFVRQLPDGLNTQIGEKGVKLSGGQRQRIGIARTLFIKPEILVMDEATSALDNETEEGVMEAVQNLSENKTIIIVAHRLTTILYCDYIYEVVEGNLRLVSREEVLAQINKKEKQEN